MTSFNDIQALLKNEFDLVNALILSYLGSEDPLIKKIGEHIIRSGGKRLRPLLVLLTAGAIGEINEKHIKLAVIIEFIHTVTLLHDDVVDASELRRGKQTANLIWGNEASILVGDFLYSRAFQMMAELNSMEVIKIFADTTNVIARGEVIQLAHCNNPNTTEAIYMQIIQGKTGALFQAATSLSSVLNNGDLEEQKALGDYGAYLGAAFQIIDDVLDYSGSFDEMGKNIGDDLSEGKTTLPLIYAMQHATDEQTALIQRSIKTGTLEHLNAILPIIHSTGSLDYAIQKASEQILLAKTALAQLAPSVHKQGLELLTDFVLERAH